MGNLRHGMSRTPEYKAWKGLKARCLNPIHPGYANYGGRGIWVAPEWLNDFPAFFAHVGKRPSPNHSIDRIDNNAGYEPGNVRWSLPTEQQNNKRDNVYLTAFGETMTLGQWARQRNLCPTLISHRLYVQELSPEKALSQIKQKSGNPGRRISAFGKSQTITKWAEELDIPYVTILTRLNRGLTPSQCLSTSSFYADGRETRYLQSQEATQ